MTNSKPVAFLWLFANIEAWLCRASNIEPIHFGIACLKVADVSFAGKLLDAGGSFGSGMSQSSGEDELGFRGHSRGFDDESRFRDDGNCGIDELVADHGVK